MNYILVLILVVILIITTTWGGSIEGLSSKRYIILMGDSILNNTGYVPYGGSVDKCLMKYHENVFMVAQDNAVMDDIEEQFESIPSDMNKSSTIIIVSIGGNDLIRHYIECGSRDEETINILFEKYKSMIKKLIRRFNGNIVLCNLYYPPFPKYRKVSEFITRWNIYLKDFAKKKDLDIIKLDKTIRKKTYFTNEIEPSIQGSKHIAKLIMDTLNDRNSTNRAFV
jgi:lysophospholipase L1-like esterase